MNYREAKLGYDATYMIQEFSSIQDFTSYLKTAPTSQLFQGVEHSKTNGFSFTGTNSFDEAMDLITKGWTIEAERLTQKLKLEKIEAPKTTRPTYDVVGYQASVPRYLQGVPTNMVTRKPEIRKQKIVKLYHDITYSFNVDKDKIEEEGVKVLKLVQALEAQGYRIELNVCFLAREGREIPTGLVKIKGAEERMSISKVAFPLVHPSMLRRLFFRFEECLPNLTNSMFSSCYGSPRGELIKQILPKNAFFVPNFINDVDAFVKYIASKC
jgi:hypothetical protein